MRAVRKKTYMLFSHGTWYILLVHIKQETEIEYLSLPKAYLYLIYLVFESADMSLNRYRYLANVIIAQSK
jgi:hypothetical protein